jgi:hypothetical protein
MFQARSGINMSLQETKDLLYKFHHESASIQAIYTGSTNAVSMVLRGVLRPPTDDLLWTIVPEGGCEGDAISIDLSVAVVLTYGDQHTVSGFDMFPFRLRVVSALSFTFADGATLSLFEIDLSAWPITSDDE